MVHVFEKAAMSRFLFFCPYSIASCICSGVSFERTACAGLKTNKHKIKMKILVCKNNFLVTDSFPSIIAKLFLQAFLSSSIVIILHWIQQGLLPCVRPLLLRQLQWILPVLPLLLQRAQLLPALP